MRAEHEINYVFSMFLPVESTLVAHSVLFIIQNHCFAITLQLLDTWSWWYCFLWSPQTSLWHIWCFPSLSADQRKDHCEPAGLRNSQQRTPHQLLVSDWTVWKKRKKRKKKHWLNTFPAAQLWTLYSRAAWLFPLKLTVLIRWTWDRLGSENGVVKLSENIFQRT